MHLSRDTQMHGRLVLIVLIAMEEWPLLAKEKRRIAADTIGINPPLC